MIVYQLPNTIKAKGKEREGKILIHCPFHDDNNPSAVFFPSNGSIFCFVCGKFEREKVESNFGSMEFYEDKSRQLKSKFIEKEEHKLSEIQRFKELKTALGNTYLHGRGITDELIEEYNILEDVDGVVIPMPDRDGKVFCYQKRYYNSEPKYITYGVIPPIYPYNKFFEEKDKEKLYFVEGAFGALIGRKQGLHSYSFLGCQKANTPEVLHCLNLSASPHIIFDSDEAGFKMKERMKNVLPHLVLLNNFMPDEIENWPI